MKKYLVRVLETVEHEFELEASSPEEAENVYLNMNFKELQRLDCGNGQGHWDMPWAIEEIEYD